MRYRGYPTAGCLILSIVLLIAGCSQQEVQPPPPGPEAKGVLEIIVQGVERADIVVMDAEGVAYEGTVRGKTELALTAGEYSIDGLPQTDTVDPTAMRVKVEANSRTAAELRYEPRSVPAPSAPVASIAIEAVRDLAGAALPSQPEANVNKDVLLYAAQTEEPACVTVRATDAGGNPVAGAQLSISTAESGFSDDRIAILRGCATDASQLAPASFRDGIYTDEDGTATFTLLPLLGSDGAATAEDVARIVVAAEGEGASAAFIEFKLVPYNLAHLWVSFEGNDPIATERRVGSSYEVENIFDPNDRRGDPLRNAFGIEVDLYTKQPQADLPVGEIGFICFYLAAGQDVTTLQGHDGMVTIDGQACYQDFDGSVTLLPHEDLGPEDTPFEATVHAVLYVQLSFGDSTYHFPLKDLAVTKRYISGILAIDKMVDHHILTWYGDNLDLIDGEPTDPVDVIDYTLEPANAVPADSVFTATFTLQAENTSATETAYDVTLRDELPAELGVIESTLTDGGSYNSVNHVVTWPVGTLAPGETVTRTFQVYVRQKPGFCVDVEDIQAATFYAVGFDSADDYCYDDPYEVINGARLRDVTVAYFFRAPAEGGGFQQVADFNGYAHEDQVAIYAVRPIFDLDKVLLNERDQPLDVGMAGVFGLEITNYDRTDPGLAGVVDALGVPVYNAAYGELADAHPDEFNGVERDNPYGRNVGLSDIFLIGLDYTSATPLAVTDDEGRAADASYAPVFIGSPDNPPPGYEPYLIDFGDKAVVWESVPIMGGGDYGTARLTLNNNLPLAHINLAALTAGNMNQSVDYGDCDPFAIDDYGFEGLAAEELEVVFGESFSFILDCAGVEVMAPSEAWLELNDVGNYEVLEVLGSPIPFTTVVERGDTFYYVFTVENGGLDTADRATLAVEIDDLDRAEVLDAFSTAGAPVSTAGNRITFGPYDHPSGAFAIFVVEMEARRTGNQTATATVDWDADGNDSQFPYLPYSVRETVSIQPPQ